MHTIILIGPPGSGKSTCGQLLSEKLGCQFVDSDQLVKQSAGMTVADIFSQQGEARFRQLETAVIDTLLHEKTSRREEPDQTDRTDQSTEPDRTVLSTGGGLPVFHNNMDKLLALGCVVYLYARLEILESRVDGGETRPLLAAASSAGNRTDCSSPSDKSDKSATYRRLEQLLSERAPVYGRARYKIDTSDLTAPEVVNKIAHLLGLAAAKEQPAG